jgi:tetratricopeptide (TPR) repeat protein
MSAADEPLNGRKTVADGSGDETPPRRRSFLSVLRHPLTWASRLIIQFRQDNPRQQLTILYQVVGMTGLLIAGGIGLSRFLLPLEPGDTAPNLFAITQALAKTSSSDVTLRATRRLEAIIGELAALRRQEPALAADIDAAFADLGKGNTTQAEAVLRKKIAQSAGVQATERRKRAEYHRYLAGVVFVQSKDSALRELQAAALEDPDSFNIMRDLGDVALAAGNSGEAERAFRESLRLAHAASDPSQEVQSLFGLGDAMFVRGNGAAAIGAYEQASKLTEQEIQRNPSNSQHKLVLAISVMKVADVLRDRIGDRDGALKSLRRALAMLQEQSKAQPGNETLQAELANCLGNIGDIQREKGERGDAIEVYRDSLAIRRKLADQSPADGNARLDLAIGLRRTGDILRDKGDLDAALAAYREDLALLTRLADGDPTNARWQRGLRVSYVRVGDVLRETGASEDALKHYQFGLDIALKLGAYDGQNTVWQRDLALTYDRIADIRSGQRRLDDALAALRHGLDIRKQLTARDPSNTQWQRSILVGMVKLGDIYKAQDQRDTAAESYRNALVIAQKLSQRDPTNVLWQSDVAEVLWDLAEIGIDQRQNLEAVVKTLEPIEKSGLLSETQRKFLPQAKKKLAELSGAR